MALNLKGFNTLSSFRRSNNGGGRWVPQGTIGRGATVIIAGASGQVAKAGGYLKQNGKFQIRDEVTVLDTGKSNHVSVLETLAESMEILNSAGKLAGSVFYVPNSAYGALARLKREAQVTNAGLDEFLEEYFENKSSEVQEGEYEAIATIATFLEKVSEEGGRIGLECIPSKNTIDVWERAAKRNPQGRQNQVRELIKELTSRVWGALPVQEQIEITGLEEESQEGEIIAF